MSLFKKLFCKKKKETKPDFERALKFTLRWEGGYVNDPKDPGGETKWGISKRAYPDVDIKGLTQEQAEVLYKQDYWQKADCHKLKWPLNLVMFDTAVNLGVSRAVRMKNKSEEHADKAIYALNIITRREEYYRRLAKRKKTFEKYLKGWLNRTRALKCYIIKGEKYDETSV